MIPPVTVYKNIVPESVRVDLCTWFEEPDDLVDSRPDCVSKSPEWNSGNWPQHLLEPVIKYLHSEDYEVEMTRFFHNIHSRFMVHVDSGLGKAHQSIYQAMIIPLAVAGDVGTVFFKNYWTDRCSKFTKKPSLESYTYQSNGDLKNQTVLDYRGIQGYSGRPFNQNVYNRYLQHIDYDDLEGLEFDCYVPWVPGDVIVFPREQLHAASSGVLPKLGVSVFTNRIQ